MTDEATAAFLKRGYIIVTVVYYQNGSKTLTLTLALNTPKYPILSAKLKIITLTVIFSNLVPNLSVLRH